MTGSISKVGDSMVRTALYEAASDDAHAHRALLGVEELGDGGRQAARNEEGAVALARKLGVILHRMWVDGTSFRWSNEHAAIA